ncbi:MAG TPA: MraY family glycosyltransferase [Polyangiaceae bacterium]|nr:MraY family glycosyltransferase [Polyangiaceae bacterium]
MRAFVFAFLLAAASSALLTPLVRALALKLGAVSNPGGRNINERTVPRLGGIAIALGFLIPLATIFPAESAVAAVLRGESRKLIGLLAGAALMAGVGVLDDTKRVRALHKLLVQIVAGAIAYSVGFHIDAVTLPIFGNLSMGIFALPVTVIWIVGIVNAINLIDGLDGLAAGVVFFAGVTNFVVAWVTGDTFLSALMATMLGAVLGFLFFNFNPARIFMGDSGSYFLGFLLGTLSLEGSSQKASTTVSILVPILALGLPIFDTLFAMGRRFLERRPLFSPDRGHVHHRLLDMGLTHKRAVLLLYSVSVIFTVAAIGVSLGRAWQVGVAILVASVVLVGLVRFVGYFEYLFLMHRQRARVRSPDVEVLRRALPAVTGLFAAAMSEEAVWRVLEGVLVRADLAAVELRAAVPRESLAVRSPAPLKIWARDIELEPEVAVWAQFPIGEDRVARASLRFRWGNPTGEVPPQAEVLLQVMVDVITSALVRAGSAFAPLPATAPLPDRISSERISSDRISAHEPMVVEP